jgi:assimilatory nitrate reductase catalytic subunit
MNPSATGTGVKTTCPYCGVGCGVVVTPRAGEEPAVAGDETHPANFGKLCVKGSALGQTVDLEGRLLHPMVHGQRATWARAVNFISSGLSRILAEHGPDAVGLYLSGQMLTEDYYVANKFAKGFLGTGHVDTNSRLCMASSVAGHRRAFGTDTVPNSYEDIDGADLIILVGSNAAWCHPVLFQRMQAARETRGAKLINIDPRRTATSEGADLHLSIAPGMDSVLFSHLLVEIAARGAMDGAYVAAHTSGLEDALAQARAIAPDLATVIARTGLSALQIEAFTDLFIATKRVVTCYSQGVNQSAQGADKVNAILNCHLATGRIGKIGSGPLSLTGQPNAMGGREVGGLANMLAAHMNYTQPDIDRVRRFWNAPNMAEAEGLKAVQMFEAIESGRIKALWVMHTNPAVTLPRADAMRSALKKLDLFIVSEAMAATDTSLAGAHVQLPATAWGEKDGTVTNSERRISRQRAFLPPPGEAKPDWEHMALVARAMGHGEAFAYQSAADIFREHAALSGFENHGGEGGSLRDFDISGAAEMEDDAFAAMEPFQWPWREENRSGEEPGGRFFSEGGFFTPDRMGRFIAVKDPALAVAANEDFPLLLNTGRLRDHWHSMTRTGKASTLARHRAEPLLELHPQTALSHGLTNGAYARIESPHGSATLRVALDSGLPHGMAFAPFHWTAMTGGLVRIDAVVQGKTDPVSGQPEMKATPIRLSRVEMRAEGFIVSRTRTELPAWLQHARLKVEGGEAVLFASTREPAALHAILENSIPALKARRTLSDPAGDHHRALSFEGHRLDVALFTASERDGTAVDWLIELLAKPALDASERRAALAGQPPAGRVDQGPIICSCFAVRRATIEAAALAGAGDADQIGAELKAGTNCGSCRPEIRRIIHDVSAASPLAAE